MKWSFTDLQTDFLQSTGNGNSTDTTLLDFFKRHLASRYQMLFSEFTNQQTQQVKTGSTVVGQQYYHYPAGIVDIESATITIGSYPYPLIPIDSELQWENLNLQLIAVTAVPQFIFPRRDDFGIWPIPQGVYTITFYPHIRDRSLSVADYVTGTVTVTNNSQTVTGSGTSWTSAMVGRWFTMNDPEQQGEGYWYRISAVASTTSLTLETSYEQTTAASATYRIGEVPEVPEEMHMPLSCGVIADFYAGPRKDVEKATWYNNIFWTGDGNNSKRQDMKFIGGVLGAQQRYSGRADGAIVWKHGNSTSWTDRMWASSIS